MHPNLSNISLYSVFLSSAVFIAVIGIYKSSKILSLSKANRIGITAGISILAIVGARLFHFLINYDAYSNNKNLLFSLNSQGLSVYGAILMVSLVFYILKKYKRKNIWKLTDGITTYLGIGIVISRIGCFLNGCCFGKVSSLPWAVQFPLFSHAHLSQLHNEQTSLLVSLPVHPTQIYEAISVIVIIFITTKIKKKSTQPGLTTLTFIALYSLVRLVLHFIRDLPDSSVKFEAILPIIYIFVFTVCVFEIVAIHSRYHPKKS